MGISFPSVRSNSRLPPARIPTRSKEQIRATARKRIIKKVPPLDIPFHQKLAFGLSAATLASQALAFGGFASPLGILGLAFQVPLGVSLVRDCFQKPSVQTALALASFGLFFTPLKPAIQAYNTYNLCYDSYKLAQHTLNQSNGRNGWLIGRNLFVYTTNSLYSCYNLAQALQTVPFGELSTKVQSLFFPPEEFVQPVNNGMEGSPTTASFSKTTSPVTEPSTPGSCPNFYADVGVSTNPVPHNVLSPKELDAFGGVLLNPNHPIYRGTLLIDTFAKENLKLIQQGKDITKGAQYVEKLGSALAEGVHQCLEGNLQHLRKTEPQKYELISWTPNNIKAIAEKTYKPTIDMLQNERNNLSGPQAEKLDKIIQAYRTSTDKLITGVWSRIASPVAIPEKLPYTPTALTSPSSASTSLMPYESIEPRHTFSSKELVVFKDVLLDSNHFIYRGTSLIDRFAKEILKLILQGKDITKETQYVEKLGSALAEPVHKCLEGNLRHLKEKASQEYQLVSWTPKDIETIAEGTYKPTIDMLQNERNNLSGPQAEKVSTIIQAFQTSASKLATGVWDRIDSTAQPAVSPTVDIPPPPSVVSENAKLAENALAQPMLQRLRNLVTAPKNIADAGDVLKKKPLEENSYSSAKPKNVFKAEETLKETPLKRPPNSVVTPKNTASAGDVLQEKPLKKNAYSSLKPKNIFTAEEALKQTPLKRLKKTIDFPRHIVDTGKILKGNPLKKTPQQAPENIFKAEEMLKETPLKRPEKTTVTFNHIDDAKTVLEQAPLKRNISSPKVPVEPVEEIANNPPSVNVTTADSSPQTIKVEEAKPLPKILEIEPRYTLFPKELEAFVGVLLDPTHPVHQKTSLINTFAKENLKLVQQGKDVTKGAEAVEKLGLGLAKWIHQCLEGNLQHLREREPQAYKDISWTQKDIETIAQGTYKPAIDLLLEERKSLSGEKLEKLNTIIKAFQTSASKLAADIWKLIEQK